MDRTPPAEVRRQLRSEVHFICAVPDCTSPYLSWHHFDPPWKEKEHHNPDGMIALCLEHHAKADIGTYTPKNLRQFKKEAAAKKVGATFEWHREKTLFRGGSCLFVNTEVLLNAMGRKLIWISKSPEGLDLFNIDIFNPDGTLLFSMRDNDWIVLPPVTDIEAVPSGRSLIVRSGQNDVTLKLKFRAFERDSLEKMIGRSPWLEDIKNDLRLASGEEALLCDMTAKMHYPSPVHFTPTRMKIGDTILTECYSADNPTAIAIVEEDGETRVLMGV